MRRLLFLALCAGCATAGTEQPSTGADAGIDGATIDARPDAPEPCNEIVTELLKNPAFDAEPMGAMWSEQRISPTLALVTGDGQTGGPLGGITEQSAPYDAWLGGAQGTDVLWQDFTVPARTRLLALSGFYEVRSSDSTTAVIDTAVMSFVTTADANIATAQSLDNTKRTTTWTTVNYAVSNAEMLSGTTVRLKMTSTNNALINPTTGQGATSFYWDTMSIKATHCMP